MMTQAAQDRSSPLQDHQNFAEDWEENNSSSLPSRGERKAVSDESPKYLSDLVAMGFSEELARVVLENCPKKPLHELVSILSDMQEVIATPLVP
jgi:hypothetical protein